MIYNMCIVYLYIIVMTQICLYTLTSVRIHTVCLCETMCKQRVIDIFQKTLIS